MVNVRVSYLRVLEFNVSLYIRLRYGVVEGRGLVDGGRQLQQGGGRWGSWEKFGWLGTHERGGFL